jgi:hypothetical protein
MERCWDSGSPLRMRILIGQEVNQAQGILAAIDCRPVRFLHGAVHLISEGIAKQSRRCLVGPGIHPIE